MPGLGLQMVDLDPASAVGLVALGLVGGILGGFIGGGGSFVMVPGLMSWGSEGLVAVGSNLLHRLGRMSTATNRHAALRNVDVRLLVYLTVPGIVGVEVGRLVTGLLRQRLGHATADLYVSLVLIVVLVVVTRVLVVDLLRVRGHRRGGGPGPHPLTAKGVAQRIRPLMVPPIIRFPASNVLVSLWLVLGIGFLSGWLAGSIALGGFIAVPAMIYLLGVPASVAISTDAALVLLVGGYGSLTFAARGLVDLRATVLLFAGSILGFHLGLLGARLLRNEPVRILTCLVLGAVILSRVVALPLSVGGAGWLSLGETSKVVLQAVSLGLIYLGGAVAVAMVAGAVVRGAAGRTVGLSTVDVVDRGEG